MEGSSPSVVTSRLRIKYRKSAWCVHQFDVCSTELVCRVVAVRMHDSVLLWMGCSGRPQLTDVAIGVPNTLEGGDRALGTILSGTDSWSVSLARRLAASLSQPVFICCGESFDRLTGPLVERGIMSEIKSRPECF